MLCGVCALATRSRPDRDARCGTARREKFGERAFQDPLAPAKL